MSRFRNFIKTIVTKKITIFKIEFFYSTLFAIVLFFILSVMNIFNFIIALIASNFYWALGQSILFAWNTGFLYYNWLLNKIQISMEKSKI